jgi:cytochrome c-type biogenesis protein
MDVAAPGIGVAFIAGFLSFISPCVLPLIPAYIGYLGGRATNRMASELATGAGGGGGAVAAMPLSPASKSVPQANRLGVMAHGLFFVTGFTLFFVTFGLITNVSIQMLRAAFDIQDLLRKLGGMLMILFGLYVMGLLGWGLRTLRDKVNWQGPAGEKFQSGIERIIGLLYRDTRQQVNPNNGYGYLGSGLMGIGFAAGWTPCIGPIYGSILALSASRSAWGDAGVLLLAYSLGLGVPFLITAAMLNQTRGLLKRLQRHMRKIEIVSGIFLIFIGYLLLTNQLTMLAQFGAGLGDLEYRLEACIADGVFRGKVPLSELGTCLNLGPNYKELIPKQSAGAIGVTLALLSDGRLLYAR